MDGTAEVPTEVGVRLCMVEVEMVAPEEGELVRGETQFPGDVAPADGKGVVVFDDERHGMVVKYLRECVCL